MRCSWLDWPQYATGHISRVKRGSLPCWRHFHSWWHLVTAFSQTCFGCGSPAWSSQTCLWPSSRNPGYRQNLSSDCVARRTSSEVWIEAFAVCWEESRRGCQIWFATWPYFWCQAFSRKFEALLSRVGRCSSACKKTYRKGIKRRVLGDFRPLPSACLNQVAPTF